MTLTFDWLPDYSAELRTFDQIPLLGLPDFPWQQLSQLLAKTFESPEFEISPQTIRWREKNKLFEDLQEKIISLVFFIPNLEGEAYWLMSEEEVTLLECLMLTNETNPLTIQDQDFKTSFYRFLALESLYAISQVISDKTIVPILADSQKIPNETSLSLDISIKINQRLLKGRIIISPRLRQEISNYTSNSRLVEKKNTSIQSFVSVNLEIGHLTLPLSQWQKVSVGDFVILDKCDIDLEKKQGFLTLSAFGRQAFKAEWQGDSTVKIIEFPIYKEEERVMVNNFKDNENEDKDENSDFDFDDEDFDELDEHLFDDFEDEESEDSELTERPETKETEQNHITEVNESSILSDETSSTNYEVSSQENNNAALALPTQGLLKPDQIPLSIVVELGKIQLSMEKMQQLEPGNLLDIEIQPENGVDLTFNGQLIAKGELIRLGGNLGVRILEVG